MSIGLNDLKARRPTATTTKTAAPKVEKPELRSETARPWTNETSANGLGRSRKKPDITDTVMNEDWLKLNFALPYHQFEGDAFADAHFTRLRRRLESYERTVISWVTTPIKTLRALRRFYHL